MKKFCAFLLLAALIACALPLAALAEGAKEPAWAGDLVLTSTTLYSDAGMKHAVGRIPGKTAVVCKAFLNGRFYRENKVAKIHYKGKNCYIRTSKLLFNNYSAKADVTLPKGIVIYQRPSKKSASIKLQESKTVWHIGTKGKWALVREATADYDGMFGFVYLGK